MDGTIYNVNSIRASFSTKIVDTYMYSACMARQ